MFRSRSEQSLLLDDEAVLHRQQFVLLTSSVGGSMAHLVPMKNPLPTAKQIPTILNAGLAWSTRATAEVEAETVALEVTVDDMLSEYTVRPVQGVGNKRSKKLSCCRKQMIRKKVTFR